MTRAPLPTALRPWAPLLDRLPPVIAETLGPWLPRLAVALGPLRRPQADPLGEPDGFAGLDRRGPYERLLLGEWLLAEEAPLEFLRRAATGEHAFFQLARTRPAAAQRVVVLLDAGPEQLGAPRLAHLAALLVLAQRAEAAGAALAWGVLQDPERALDDGFDAPSLRALLAARTALTPDAAMLDAWRRRLGAPGPGETRWLVGGPGLARAPADLAAGRVLVEEPLTAPEQLRLEVRSAPDTLPVRLALPLPDPATAVRIIREPFPAAPAPPPAAGAGSVPPLAGPLRFAQRRDRLFVGLRDGGVAALHVPGSRRAAAGRTLSFQPWVTSTFWAVAMPRSGMPLALTLAADEVVLRLRNRVMRRWPRPPALAPAATLAGLAPSATGFHALDGAGRLWSFPRLTSDAPALVADGVTAVEETHGTEMVWVEGAAGGPPVIRWARDQQSSRDLPLDPVPAGALALDTSTWVPPTSFFGWGGPLGHPTFGLAAVRREPQRWSVVGVRTWEVHVPRTCQVVGVVAPPGAEAPALVVVDGSRSAVQLLSAGDAPRPLATPGGRVAHVAVARDRPRIAWLSDLEGATLLEVLDLGRHETVLRLLARAS